MREKATILQRRATVNQRFTIVLIGQLITGACFGETATLIYKNGQVEFGDFKRMSADSVYIDKTGTGGIRERAVIAKPSLSEVIFDSGEKLNLSLAEHPPGSSPATAAQLPVAPQIPAHEQAAIVATAPAPQETAQTIPAVFGTPQVSPFVYGGISALIPGLGQTLAGKPGKGAAIFGIIATSTGGSLLAWHYTTKAYHQLLNNKSADGFYPESDYRQFTFRLHGAEILTGVSAILYLLNIADATADAFAFNRHPSVKPSVTVSSTATGCALAVAF